MERIQKNAGGSDGGDDEAGVVSAAANTSASDALLDEIDGVLESNAEEFVRGYVQKGGQ